MFSDFKTRGFNLEDSQIARTDPAGPARSSAGAGPPLGGVDRNVGCRREPNPGRKKAAGTHRKNVARSLMSFFTRGLRRLRLCLQRLIAPPPLWATWKNDGW